MRCGKRVSWVSRRNRTRTWASNKKTSEEIYFAPFSCPGNGKLKIKMPSKVKKINLVAGGKGKGIKWILRSYSREQSANKGC